MKYIVVAFLMIQGLFGLDLVQDPEFKSSLKDKNPWIVLGFVADSEKEPEINSQGHELRKQVEQQLQQQGLEVIPLSMSHRLKLEKMWSSPYQGRLPQSLIEGYLKKEGLNCVTGSYPERNSNQITILYYLNSDAKSRFFYVDQAKADPISKSQTDVNARRNLKGEKPEAEQKSRPSWVWLEKDVAERKKPSRASRRTLRARRRPNIKDLEQALLKDPQLLAFQKPYKEQSESKIAGVVQEMIQKAEKSWLSQKSAELYTQAFILSRLLPKNEDLDQHLLREILEREVFNVDQGDHSR